MTPSTGEPSVPDDSDADLIAPVGAERARSAPEPPAPEDPLAEDPLAEDALAGVTPRPVELAVDPFAEAAAPSTAPAASDDPFARDALGEAPAPRPVELAFDPFASVAAAAAAAGAPPPAAAPPSADPFADDPLADVPVPAPAALGGADPFAEPTPASDEAQPEAGADPDAAAEPGAPAAERAEPEPRPPLEAAGPAEVDPFAADPLGDAPPPAPVELDRDPFADVEGAPAKPPSAKDELTTTARVKVGAVRALAGGERARSSRAPRAEAARERPALPAPPAPPASDCPICAGALLEAAAASDPRCAACGQRVHAACAAEGGRCPAAGCLGRLARPGESLAGAPSVVPRRRPHPALVGTACLVVVVAIAAVGLVVIERDAQRAERDAFLAAAATLGPDEVLTRAARLTPATRSDPEVAALVARLTDEQADQAARAEAEAALRRARALPDLAARLAALDAVIAAAPDLGAAYRARAQVRARLARRAPGPSPEGRRERMREALADLHAAIHHAPGAAEGYLERGALYLELGERQAGLADLERAVELGNGPLVAMARGLQAEAAGEPSAALAGFGDAAQRDPDWPGARLGCARAHLALGEPREALREAEWARKQDPGDAEPYVLIARARRALGQEGEELRRAVEQALERAPDEPRALALRADLTLPRTSEGGLSADPAARAAARRDAERARAGAPDDPLATLVLAELAAAAGESPQALRLLEAAASADPAGPDRLLRARALALRARLLVAQGLADEAVLSDLDQAAEALPRRALVFALRGRLHLRRGALAAARRDLDWALHLEAGLVEARYDRAWVCLALAPADLGQALADLDAFLARRPDVSGDVYFLRAMTRWRAARWDEALADVEQAERRGGGFQPELAARIRGDALYRRREWAGARAAYERFLAAAAAPAEEMARVRRRLERCTAQLNGSRREL